MVRRHLYLASCAILALAGPLGPVEAQAQAGTPGLAATQVLKGRDVLWDMAFLADGTMFFTERCGGLSVRMPDGKVNACWGSRIPRAIPRLRRTSSAAARPA